MAFQIAYHTDIGIKKKNNQDGLLMKTARTPEGQVGLFVVCDGMGGLSEGELASSTVISGMSDWFEQALPDLLQEKQERNIVSGLDKCIRDLNEKIIQYGEAKQINLGTIVLMGRKMASHMFEEQIGDSRGYSLNGTIKQITKDQTVVARELERGNLTEEQARIDPRRNILLQCMGATKDIEVVITEDSVEPGTLYLLCTDGFYHEVLEDELLVALDQANFTNEQQMKEKVIELVELVKSRREQDNISVIVAKVI